MNLNEKQLKNIIAESVKTSIHEAIIKEQIKQFVRESLENLGGYSQYESSDEEDGRLSDMNTETDNEAETRDSIENFFKQPGVNNAPYAYKLYGVEAKEGQDTNDMKNARKKFADCVNHEKNENGYPYSFDSDELNTLKGMISGNQLDEAINKAMRKILKENNYTLSGEEKYPQYNHDADRWWKLEFESNPEAAAKKAQSVISKFENSDYRLYANEKEYYRDRAFATFGKKYLKMNGYL